ncbi:MAG TPA: VOC family protein [Streptosporangiaceae bacterium]|nr:VOC family protein [Streptosporangiaceae bacterium]
MPTRDSYAQGTPNWVGLQTSDQAAAIAPLPPEMAAAGAPPMWNTYLAVDSADEATAKVEVAGGTVGMAPFDVMNAGRMSFVLDPSGAAVALWQADKHIGATLVNEPGTINWNELNHWHVYFGTDDADPQGAVFSVIKSAPA